MIIEWLRLIVRLTETKKSAISIEFHPQIENLWTTQTTRQEPVHCSIAFIWMITLLYLLVNSNWPDNKSLFRSEMDNKPKTFLFSYFVDKSRGKCSDPP